MNHQLFRDWLLSEDDLTPNQKILLKDHLLSCESCRLVATSWLQVDSTLRKATYAEPAAGFASRWQLHLQEYQERMRRRHGWMMIGGTLIIVIALLTLTVSQVIAIIQSPGPYLEVWFTRLISLISLYFNIQNMFSLFNWDIPIFAFVGLYFVIGVVSFMSVFWLATYRKLSTARRII
jgi:hypothetical protein